MSLLAAEARPSEADLDTLLANLEVRFAQLAECRLGQYDGVALQRSELPSCVW